VSSLRMPEGQPLALPSPLVSAALMSWSTSAELPRLLRRSSASRKPSWS
jgi:hypothetical protein